MAPNKPPQKGGSSSSSFKPHLKHVKGENFYRGPKAARTLKMLSGGKPVRDKDGKIVKAAEWQKGEGEIEKGAGRIQPDRRWFGASDFLLFTSAFPLTRASSTQETHELYPKPLWNTSETLWRLKKMTLTLSYLNVINFL
jgi:hypothetical protein